MLEYLHDIPWVEYLILGPSIIVFVLVVLFSIALVVWLANKCKILAGIIAIILAFDWIIEILARLAAVPYEYTTIVFTLAPEKPTFLEAGLMIAAILAQLGFILGFVIWVKDGGLEGKKVVLFEKKKSTNKRSK